jgi:ABC-2 type transport system ATP-binding protein
MIKVESLTKEFRGGRGVFDVDFTVESGEILGFIGPNGAGKSTTIRHLMGFLRPDAGRTSISGHDCWLEPADAHARLSYLPGEIAFPTGISAEAFLDLQSAVNGRRDPMRRAALVERFELNLKAPILRMSKGMKQKLALVAAFQAESDVVILDEPSSGLDPVMQEELIDMLLEEKRRGATVLLSSHIFEEVESLADRVCIIRSGRIVEDARMSDIEAGLEKRLIVTFVDNVAVDDFAVDCRTVDARTVEFPLHANHDAVLHEVAARSVLDMRTSVTTLREHFHDQYSVRG